MATYLSPGVYSREIDVSTYAATVASSVLAYVGAAAKGPVNKPTLMTNPTIGTSIFGKPLQIGNSLARFGLLGALKGSDNTSQVWFTRVTDGTEAAASAIASALINSQVLYGAHDDAGITVVGGAITFAMQVYKRSGTVLGADAFNALVRQFGANNIFDATFNTITSLAALNTAIAGTGAFVQVLVQMASATKVFGNLSAFVSRFNALMSLPGPLRAEAIQVTDNVNGVQNYLSIKTQNLSGLVALNLEFKLVDDTQTVSPTQGGYATMPYDGGHPHSQMQFTAKKPGIGGNGIRVVLVNVGNTFSGLPPVVVSGNTITVSINVGVTTAASVVQAINANTTARLRIVAINSAGSNGTALIATAHTVQLTQGGSNLPAELHNPVSDDIGTVNLSSSHTQRINTTGPSANFEFDAVSPGDYANGALITFSHDDSGLMAVQYQEGKQAAEKAVALRIQPSGVAGSFIDALASFTNIEDLAPAAYTLFSATANLSTALGGIDVITDVAMRSFLTWNAYEFYEAVQPVFAGGESGVPDDAADLVDAVIGNPADKTGLYGYANREAFNNSILFAPGFYQPAVIRAGLGIAEKGGDMMFFADPPPGPVDSSGKYSVGLTSQEVVDWHNGQGGGNSSAFNSSFGALYYGWVPIQDLYNGEGTIWVPPSVLVGKQIAYSDNVSEVWFAPAGFKRGVLLDALGVQSNATCDQGERDFMYSGGNAVNPLVNFPQDGVVIFGQRTLQRAASALDRINVRRMLNFVKRTSVNAVRIDLFDPDDAVLWTQLQGKLNPIFQDVKNKRGINNFLVKIDSSTTPQLAIDNNEVYGYIVIEPTKAAEKIILSFVITAQGASFSEALAAAGVA